MINPGSIILKIAPLVAAYKQYVSETNGTNALGIMWDIGDILQQKIKETDLAPHQLFREIYGKSETKFNIVQRSYISREFQGRCYRVRKLFITRDAISMTFSDIKNIGLFLDILPFLDNPKYKLIGREREELISVINSNLSNKRKQAFIKRLKEQRIGVKNPRDQRLNELQNDLKVFMVFYNKMKERIDFQDYIKASEGLPIVFFRILSKNTSALSSDGLKTYDFEIPDHLDDSLKEYAFLVTKYISKSSVTEQRRFRRLVTQRKMVDLAEMLFALTDNEAYKNFTKGTRMK